MVDPHPLTKSSDDHKAAILSLDHEAEMLHLYMAAMVFCKCYEVCHGEEDEPHEPGPPELYEQRALDQYVQAVDVLLVAAEAVRSASAELQHQMDASQPG